jgi:hypothetical protein
MVNEASRPQCHSRTRNAVLWCTLVVIGLCMAATALTQSRGPAFSPDSTVYVEQARNILAGKGPLSTPLAIDTLSSAEHSPLFPPGFATSMAFISRVTGTPPETAGSLLNLVSLAAVPLLCFLCFRPSLGGVRAAVIGAFTATCSLDFGASVLTDLYSLALVLSAVALLMNGNGLCRGLLCGTFAALAYFMRNAHVAFIAALALYVAGGLVAGDYRDRSRSLFAVGGASACGLLVGAFSLWRLAVFHSLQPYAMDPSTVSVRQNIRDLILAALSYFQPREFVMVGFGPASTLIIALAALLLFAFLGFCIREWPHLSGATRRALAFCSIYTLLGFDMLVAASSKWDWGEYINARHIIQYGPFIAAMCAATTRPSSSLRSRFLTAAFCTMLIYSVSTRVYGYWETFNNDADRTSVMFTRRLAEATAALHTPLATVRIPAFDFGGTNSTDYVCSNHDQVLLVSNVGFMYDLKCGQRVRTVWERRAAKKGERWDESVVALTETAKYSRGRAVIAVMVGPDVGGDSKVAPPLFTPALVAEAQTLGWNIVRNEPGGIVATRPGTPVIQ